MKRIGFIGIGLMGSRMCKCILKAGYTVTVTDVNEEAVKELESAGANWKHTPKEVAQASDVIITMLPNSQVVEAVVLGKNGLIEGFKKSDVLIDMSSSLPSSTRMLAEKLEIKGVEMIDAPVSGGPSGAESGTLSVMVGGKEQVFNEIKPILDVLGSKVFYIGGIGAGHVTKAVNNALYATTLVAACETITLGVKAGIDPSKLIEVIGSCSGQCYASNKFKNYTLKRNFKPGFALDLLAKDVDIALTMSSEMKVPMVTSHTAREFLMMGQQKGFGKDDNTRIIEMLEELVGVRVVAADK